MIPAWLVAVMSGWKGVKGCWPAILVCGGSFASVQFCMANLHGPTLVDVFGGVVSLTATTLFLRFWQPKEIWRFSEEREGEPPPSTVPHVSPLAAGHWSVAETPTARQVAYAWMPWVVSLADGVSVGMASMENGAQRRHTGRAQFLGRHRKGDD